MSQKKNTNPKTKKSKVVVTSKGQKAKPKVVPTVSKRSTQASKTQRQPQEMMFNRDNYIFMLAGVGLIIVGLALMSGGKMPSPDVWDENLIYGFRRTVLAPFVILAGLGLEVYAIFK